MAKESKSQVGYIPHKPAKPQCRTCDHFRSPGSCTKVAGSINPDGYCAPYYEPIKK